MKKEILKKMLGSTLALAMIFGSVPVFAEETTEDTTVEETPEITYGSYMGWDFDSSASQNWTFTEGLVTGSEMTYKTEADGNGYMSMKITSGTTVATADGTMDKTPNAAIVLDEPYYLEPSATTVISTKVRFSEIPATALRIPFAINIPSNFNKTSGLKSFWTFISGTGFVRTEKNSGATTDLNYLPTEHYGKYNYTSARNTMVASSKLSANTWYTVKTTITTDVNGKPETVCYNIKGGDVDYETEALTVEQWSLIDANADKISSLNVVFDIRAALENDFYYDIDDVYIYNPENYEAALKDISFFDEAEELNISLLAEPDDAEKLIEKVKIYNEENAEQEISSVTYDEALKCVKIVPENPLPVGNYKVTAGITIAGVEINTTEFSFVVTEGFMSFGDFENDIDSWTFNAGQVAGAEMTHKTEENANGYASVKLTKEIKPTDYDIANSPYASLVLEKPYYFAPNAETVLSAKIRVSEIPGTDLRVPLALNIPSNYNSHSALKSFWMWTNGGFYRVEKNESSTTGLNYLPDGHYGKYKNAPYRNAMVASSKLSANTWYTVKATITTDASGKPATVVYNVKGGDVNYTSSAQEVTQWSLLDDNSNKISSLNFVFNVRAALANDFVYDIDDVCVYNPEYLKAELSESVFAGSVKDIKVNASGKITSGDLVKVYNEEGAEVPAKAVADNNQLTITLDEAQTAQGEYTLDLSKVKVNGVALPESELKFNVIPEYVKLDNWSFSEGTETVGSKMEESDGYKRITIPAMAKPTGTRHVSSSAHAYVDLEEAYKLKENAEVVISAKMRTSNTVGNIRKQFLLNATQSSLYNNWNLDLLWNQRENGSLLNAPRNADVNVGSGYGTGKPQGGPSEIVSTGFQPDEWYDIKTILTTDENGYICAVRYIVEGAGVQYATENEVVNQWSLVEKNEISRLSFSFLVLEDLEEALTFDFKDMSIRTLGKTIENSVEITDIDGNALDSLAGEVFASFTYSHEGYNVTMQKILALYEKQGDLLKLVTVVKEDVPVTAYDSFEGVMAKSITVPDDEKDYVVKAFLWDNNLKAYCASDILD